MIHWNLIRAFNDIGDIICRMFLALYPTITILTCKLNLIHCKSRNFESCTQLSGGFIERTKIRYKGVDIILIILSVKLFQRIVIHRQLNIYLLGCKIFGCLFTVQVNTNLGCQNRVGWGGNEKGSPLLLMDKRVVDFTRTPFNLKNMTDSCFYIKYEKRSLFCARYSHPAQIYNQTKIERQHLIKRNDSS